MCKDIMNINDKNFSIIEPDQKLGATAGVTSTLSTLEILNKINPALLINEMLEVYRDVKTCSQVEETKRAEINAKIKMYTKALEENTEKAKISMEYSHIERMALIQNITNLLSRDTLDENVVKICELILNDLSKKNSLKSIEK